MTPELILLNENRFNFIFESIVAEVKLDLGEKGAGFCAYLEKHKTALFRCYDGVRSNVRFRYMQNPDSHLDRHKCAAAFMISFLNVFEIKEHLLNKEKLAINLGLLILKIFINTKNKNYRDAAMVIFIDKHGFKFPDSICDEGTYKHNWALGLYYDRKEGILSALSLANALFLIESHNRNLARAKYNPTTPTHS